MNTVEKTDIAISIMAILLVIVGISTWIFILAHTSKSEEKMTTLSTNKTANISLVKDLSRKSWPDNKVLADLTTTQAILESDLNESLSKNRAKGGSELATQYQNLFGIKAHGSLIPVGTKGVIYLTTTEYVGGKKTSPKEPFLYNFNIEDSIAQHKKLFTESPRYKALLSAKTFEEAAKVVRECGYATDPNYTKELIEVYDKYVKDKTS